MEEKISLDVQKDDKVNEPEREHYRRKIGILTWYYAMNHGARAHTYALLHTLRNLGHDAEIIAYRSWRSYLEVEPYWFVSRNVPLMLRRFRYRMYFKKTEAEFKYLSRKVHSAKEIDKLGYDLIILGSDEIFNINHLISSKDYTYFGVGIRKTPMITYAVSCGQSAENTKWPEEVIDSIKRIRALSVRDKNSQKVVKANTGINSELVLDPTLLYDFSELNDPEWKYKDYVLIYTFGGIEKYKDEIISYARDSKLIMICVGNKFDWADICVQYPKQETWYAAFAGASLVITNSFHGTIFAIKNRVPFVNILMADKETKISNLLRQFGIIFEERLMTNERSIEKCNANVLNFEKIDDEIRANNERSIKWLQSVVENIYV